MTALDESIGVVSVILTLPFVVTSVKCNSSLVEVNPTDRLMVGRNKKKYWLVRVVTFCVQQVPIKLMFRCKIFYVST